MESKEILQQIEKGTRYTSLGCYPLFYYTADNSVICCDCAIENTQSIKEAIENPNNDRQWEIVGCDVNWENHFLYCDECSSSIESAYPPDNVCEYCGKADYNSTEQENFFCSEECQKNHENQ